MSVELPISAESVIRGAASESVKRLEEKSVAAGYWIACGSRAAILNPVDHVTWIDAGRARRCLLNKVELIPVGTVRDSHRRVVVCCRGVHPDGDTNDRVWVDFARLSYRHTYQLLTKGSWTELDGQGGESDCRVNEAGVEEKSVRGDEEGLGRLDWLRRKISGAY